eukprot:TRINITY_DN3054_c0_g1_i17.p1 TRINITY_DN3054_c0_g1~~TRINITY_DN3054_c0_g1_i17.p1  ORF type:complete len:101 (+),score=0.77 TRINITY_DN3054_c0_g1_i17:391-693(+)
MVRDSSYAASLATIVVSASNDDVTLLLAQQPAPQQDSARSSVALRHQTAGLVRNSRHACPNGSACPVTVSVDICRCPQCTPATHGTIDRTTDWTRDYTTD